MDYYRILGISSAASDEDVKQAFRRLVHQHHPDVAGQGSRERFQQILEAYEVLRDPERRRRFDQTRSSSVTEANSSVASSAGDPRVVVRHGTRQPTAAQQRQMDQTRRHIRQLLKQGSVAAAIAQAEALVQRFPQTEGIHHLLALTYAWAGNLLIQMGQRHQAKTYLRQALELEPRNRELGFEVKRDLARLEERLET